MSKAEFASFVGPQLNKYTEPLVFIPGEYKLSEEGEIPYLAAAMPLQNVVDQIKLVEDIPEEAQRNWSLEELFQRDIDWDRVQTDLVNGYLKPSSELSFFNSLTIALLPQAGSEIEESYGQPESSPLALYQDWNKIDVGNICVEYMPDRSVGVLRWHKQRIFPVAIDGQHRLAALRLHCSDLAENSPNSSRLETKIPLLFLILDKQVGFEGRPGEPIIETLRKIFIDLNKNARNVPRSRIILLDDRTIQFLCVRTLVASNVQGSSGVLPLSMVTWREDEAKFDSGYSITSVLNLNEIVSYCLPPPGSTDLLEEEEVKRYIGTIKGKLELSLEIQNSIEERAKLLTGRGELFSFDKEQLDALQKAFCEQWTPHIVRIFKEFVPYKQYLSTAKQINAIDGMLANYLLLSKKKRAQFQEEKKFEDQIFNPRSEIDEPLRMLENLKENEWAFYVVFQKALFINFFELEAQSPSLLDNQMSREDFLTWWINQINALHKQGVFNLNWKDKKGRADLWRGIAKNPISGAIQYTQAAANRVSAFITICIWFNRDKTQPEDPNAFATRLIEFGSTEYSGAKLPNIVGRALTRVRRSGLDSLIKARTDDELDDKQMIKNIKAELVKRFKAIQG